MRFTKMHGCGNDFILLDDREKKLPDEKLGALAKALCARRLSVGADGLMVIRNPEADGDFKMLFFNSDGSVGEMCGNGARCISRYGHTRGLAGKVQRIETTAGLVIGECIDERTYRVRLNDVTHYEEEKTIDAEGRPVTLSYVEMGNPAIPHAVVEMPGLAGADRKALYETGKAIRLHPAFPKGANVNFYDVEGPDTVRLLTFERGVEDFTLACGTGTGSTAFALARRGITGRENIKLMSPGGDLFVTLAGEAEKEEIYLTGPTTFVAEGEILYEDLAL